MNIKTLPVQACNTTLCITYARYWDGRFVVLGNPRDTLMGWCDLCEKYVCSKCALKVPIPQDHWERLPDTAQLKKSNADVVTLRCKRCGSYLGRYSDIHVFDRR